MPPTLWAGGGSTPFYVAVALSKKGCFIERASHIPLETATEKVIMEVSRIFEGLLRIGLFEPICMFFFVFFMHHRFPPLQ